MKNIGQKLWLCAQGGFKTMIGGQALIEGIMMLGPDKKSVVVRKPSGELEVKTEPRKVLKDKYPIVGLPLVRGVVSFASSMYNGVTALMYSAEAAGEGLEEEEEPSKFERWLDEKLGSEKLTGLIVTLSMLLGIGMSILLFFFLPTMLGTAVTLVTESMLARNLAESLLKVTIFVAYLGLCSRMGEMKRMFSYHGAEHKTIFCYENGLPLTVENVRKQPRHHPRCGTSFLFVVIIISILISTVVFSVYPVHNAFLRFFVHLLMLPLIVGVSYEFNRWVGRHENALTRVLVAPGLWLQNFTTFEPDDSMIEVGIRAFTEVLPQESGADQW